MYDAFWEDQDKLDSEDRIEFALHYLRIEGRKSPEKIDRSKKTIVNEMKFLTENFPDSYVLREGFILSGEIE